VRWLTEQRDGPYWRNGSLRPDYGRIQCPVFIVSGWHDGYRTAGVRMAQRLRSPWQLLAGPWTHVAPDRGVPRPVYPFMRELIQFFRTHLDPDSAPVHVAGRPRSVVFIEEHDAPGETPERVSGEWIASESWPASTAETVLTLGTRQTAAPSASVGLASGNWCPPPPDSGLFGDQRIDEARSACFDSEPLSDPIAVLGVPRLRFRIAHPGPRAIVSVKLNDVAPGGASQPVTRGAVNVACDGEAAVELDLMATGWRFRPGHRIRVAVAANDWPCLWPLPRLEPVNVTTAVELVVPDLPEDAEPYVPATDVVPVTWTGGVVSDRPSRWEIARDAETGMAGIEAADWSAFEFPQEGLRCEEGHVYLTGVRDDDPLSARVEGRTRFGLTRPGLDVVAEASGRFTCTESEFVVELDLAVTRDGEPFHTRRWRERIPRNGC
jgi:predicted acyl esterase